MTELACMALNCVHNHSRLCSLTQIEVAGSGADRSHDTCCASFADENEGYSNTLDSRDAEPETHIDCEAHRCVYNLEGVCDAEEVLIDGSAAHRRDDTDCDTFLSRD